MALSTGISYFSRREISRQKNRPIRMQQAYREMAKTILTKFL
jgi:hypothetical protein